LLESRQPYLDDDPAVRGFFVPQACSLQWRAAFPSGGGLVYWTRLAFGRLPGAVITSCTGSQPWVWIGGSLTITCIAAVGSFFHAAALAHAGVVRVALVFVWLLDFIAAITSFMSAGGLPTAGAFARVIVLGCLTVLGRYLRSEARRPRLGASGYQPSESGSCSWSGPAVNFVGFSCLHRRRGMTNPQRDVPFASPFAVGSCCSTPCPSSAS